MYRQYLEVQCGISKFRRKENVVSRQEVKEVCQQIEGVLIFLVKGCIIQRRYSKIKVRFRLQVLGRLRRFRYVEGKKDLVLRTEIEVLSFWKKVVVIIGV